MRNLLCRITSRRHSDTTIRIFQGQNIIHTIANHSGHIALCFQCFYDRLLFLRAHASKHCIFSNDLLQFFFLFREFSGVNIIFRFRQPCTHTHDGNRQWIVTGQYLDLNIFIAEKGKCLCCICFDDIRQNDKAHFFFIVCQKEDTHSLCRIHFCAGKNLSVFCQIFRGTQSIIPFSHDRYTHMLAAGAKWYLFGNRCPFCLRKISPQRVCRCIGFFKRIGKNA